MLAEMEAQTFDTKIRPHMSLSPSSEKSLRCSCWAFARQPFWVLSFVCHVKASIDIPTAPVGSPPVQGNTSSHGLSNCRWFQEARQTVDVRLQRTAAKWRVSSGPPPVCEGVVFLSLLVLLMTCLYQLDGLKPRYCPVMRIWDGVALLRIGFEVSPSDRHCVSLKTTSGRRALKWGTGLTVVVQDPP